MDISQVVYHVNVDNYGIYASFYMWPGNSYGHNSHVMHLLYTLTIIVMSSGRQVGFRIVIRQKMLRVTR